MAVEVNNKAIKYSKNPFSRPSTKRYWVTAHPYANQDGSINVPVDVPSDEVEDWILEHWDDIEFDEPNLEYAGTDFEFGVD